ncbi:MULTISPECIES: TetR/AcrR family transcriptional regulator C-terminal domain-containing protein [Myxococcus]|uniref:TetR/AcrR family transcriptional regulator C-terminal domain-containing protein n=1 Tax=Myxococcus TaxID=32 RepID=UPI0011442F44|nr:MULTISPECIES: TetR/AcrR family transcriptional regulator C-terminal domain-containing protein [Myxococcus]MCK8500133.1 TetR/AcrR family transcriptional regulator C-terminal domain-containing protein [Myxococcus fulvus]
MKQTHKREPLSRERILNAALDIVDREGLEAISMRRLGQALGVEAMSLYNHVPNKAAILDGLFETVLAEVPSAKRGGTWQVALRERAQALRKALRTHPNTLPLFATRAAVTPGAIAHVEAVLDTLRTAGFSPDEALSALQVLMAFVVGHSLSSYAPQPDDAQSHPAYQQLSEKDFPRVHEIARVLDSHDVEKEFELGLEAMMTGLEANPARRKPARK